MFLCCFGCKSTRSVTTSSPHVLVMAMSQSNDFSPCTVLSGIDILSTTQQTQLQYVLYLSLAAVGPGGRPLWSAPVCQLAPDTADSAIRLEIAWLCGMTQHICFSLTDIIRSRMLRVPGPRLSILVKKWSEENTTMLQWKYNAARNYGNQLWPKPTL